MNIKVKRVYEKPAKDDGFRVLVDRLWPRGMTKDKAKIDLWAKELAPSDKLRKWFQHDPEKWEEFRRRYFVDLDSLRGDMNPAIETLAARARRETVTLVFGAKETRFNNAVAIHEYLSRKAMKRKAA